MFSIPLPVLNNPQLQICTHDVELRNSWIKELKTSGLSFSQKDHALTLKTKNAVVLCVKADMEELQKLMGFPPTYFKENVFCIVSDEVSWKTFAQENNLIHLPEHTHPLEVARILIHNLNFKPRQPKPVYGFSLFNF